MAEIQVGSDAPRQTAAPTESALTQAAEAHDHHRDVSGGWLRPAVFGAMDGLVSNFALVAGVAGGGADRPVVVLTGLAGLAAGACSMAAGEYVSVASQDELTQAEIATERRELAVNPEAEHHELVRTLIGQGLSEKTAEQAAAEMGSDPDVLWRTHVRYEMGVDPDDLPSPYLAASTSFLAFTVGAVIPLLTFLIGYESILAAGAVSLVGLFVAGAVVAKMTARPAWYGGLRQTLVGLLAAAATFWFGHLVGGTLG